MIKKLSIVSIGLLLIGLIGILFTLKSALNVDKVSEEKVIEDTFTNLTVFTDNASVEIIPTTEEKTKVKLSGKGAKYQLTTDVEHSTLNIELKQTEKKLFNFNFIPKIGSLTIYVPEKQYNDIQIESNNSRIALKDLHVKDLNMKSDNGKIVLKTIQSTTIKGVTNNGKIDLTNTSATSINVYTDNGKINLSQVTGDITGKTSNGKINLLTDHLDRKIDLESDNGKIEVQTEQKPTNAQFNIQVDNGKVNLFGENNRNQIYGNGDNLVKLKTANGKITVSKK